MNEIIVESISKDMVSNVELLSEDSNQVIVQGNSSVVNLNITPDSDSFEIEISQETPPVELIVLNAFTNITSGGTGEFNPGYDYTITGQWLFTRTIETASHGNSEDWAYAYWYSQNAWVIDDYNLYFSQGVISVGSDVYHGKINVSPGLTDYAEVFSVIDNNEESIFSLQSFLRTSATVPKFISIATQTGEQNGQRAFNQLFSFNEDGKFGVGTVNGGAAVTIDAGYEKDGITQLQPLQLTNLLGEIDKGTYYFRMDTRWMSLSTKDDNGNHTGDVLTFGHDGSIGFNTNNPTHLVEIHSKGEATYIQKWYDHLNNEIGGILQYVGSIPKIYLGEAGSEVIMISHTGDSWFNGGNVGFGTNSPLYQIHAQVNQPDKSTYKFENLDPLGEASLEVDSDQGTVYIRNYGSNSLSLPSGLPIEDWKSSAIFGADNTLDGGLVFYNSTSLGSKGIRFQNTIGTDLFVVSDDVPRFKVSTIFEERAGTDGFASGFAGQGWEVKDYTISGPARHTATFDNLVVRRTLKVYELEINKIRASNGSLWVSDAMEVEYVQSVSGGYRIKVLDELNQPFLYNDIVRTQKWTGDGVKFWLGRVVNTGTEYISGKLYGWAEVQEYPSGSGYTDSPEENDTFVRVDNVSNQDRKGAVYLTSSDTGSPFIDVTFGMETESDGGVKARFGRLAGITDTEAGLNGGSWQNNLFGLYAQNVHLKGHIFAQTGEIGGWNIADYKLWAGADWYDGAALDAGIEINARDLQQVIFRDSDNYIKLYNNNDQDWGIEGVIAGTNIFDLGYTLDKFGIVRYGKISDWYMGNGAILSLTDNYGIYMYNDTGTGYGSTISYLRNHSSNIMTSVGQLRYANAWRDEFGFCLTPDYSTGDPYVQFSQNINTGALTAKISNWYFDETRLYSGFSGNNIILHSTIGSGIGSIETYSTTNRVRVALGRQFWDNAWQDEFGFALVENYQAGSPYIQFTKNMSTNVLTAQIAGWTFNNYRLTKELGGNTVWQGVFIDDSNPATPSNIGYGIKAPNTTNGANHIYMINSASDGASFLTGIIDGEAVFRLSTRTGYPSSIAGWYFDDTYLYTSKYGSVGGIELRGGDSPRLMVHQDSTNYVSSYYADSDSWGISGVSGGTSVFRLGATNHIAGWSFNDNEIYSTNIKIRNDNASIQVNKPGGGYVMMGKTYYNSAWQDEYGFSSVDENGDLLFLMDGTAQVIAGWRFDPYRLSRTLGGSTIWQGVFIDSSTPDNPANIGFGIKSPTTTGGNNDIYMINSSSDGAAFLIGRKDGEILFNLNTRSSSTISDFSFDGDKLWSVHNGTTLTIGKTKVGAYDYGFEAYVDSSNYIKLFNNDLDDSAGLKGVKDGDTIFHLKTDGDSFIAGFYFDDSEFYSVNDYYGNVSIQSPKNGSPKIKTEGRVSESYNGEAALFGHTIYCENTSNSRFSAASESSSELRVLMAGLPTSSGYLPSNSIWRDSSGYLRIT